MSLKGLLFTITIDDQIDTTLAVIDFTLYQQYSRPFVMNVKVASTIFGLVANDFLEKKIVLTIWQGDIPQRYISGIITAMDQGVNNGWQICYQLTVSPPVWRCELRQNFRIFQQQDIQTISTTLLTENGIPDWAAAFYEAHPPREFCVQYAENDLEFLTRLWSEEGIFFFENFSPDASSQTLTLCDNETGLPLVGEMPFNPNISTEVSTECISEFVYRAQIRPSSVGIKDYTFKAPGWAGFFSHDATNLNGQMTRYEIFDFPARFKDEQHGKDFARYRIDGLRSDAETATCASNSPKLWPGIRFILTGHPTAFLNKEWQVVNSILTGDQPQALHGHKGQGTTLSNQFDVIPADRTWRIPPLPKPKVDGPQSAIVTGPAGEEIFCDEHGRVRVKFHWDRYNPNTEASSCWVRVSQAWAGAGFGNLAIPRIGQEVIVDFLNGDPDQPIIMGRTYHQDNRSPGSLPGTKTQMTIRSKTYKGDGYNELRFEDAPGKEQVYIHAQKDMQTEVLHDRMTTVNHDHTETILNNQTITVGVGQTVNVGGKNESGHDQQITVAHDQTLTVHNNQKLNVVKNRDKNIGGNQTSIITGQDTETVEKDQCITVKQNYKLNVTDTTAINAGEKIELICGASSITLESSGKVTIKGTEFDFTAGGPVMINGKDVFIN